MRARFSPLRHLSRGTFHSEQRLLGRCQSLGAHTRGDRAGTRRSRWRKCMNASTPGTSSNLGARSSDFASAKDQASEAVSRGREGLSQAASTFANDASTDLEGLRRDLNNLKDTVSRFMSQAGDVSSSVANQVGNAASSLAQSGANVAAAAKDQAKTFASELENMGRRNPLGAMAGAVMVGVLIGLLTRSRSTD